MPTRERIHAREPGEFRMYPPGHVERMITSGDWANPTSPNYKTKIQWLDMLDDAINDAQRRAIRTSRHGLSRKVW